jgi:hypothetical protein
VLDPPDGAGGLSSARAAEASEKYQDAFLQRLMRFGLVSSGNVEAANAQAVEATAAHSNRPRGTPRSTSAADALQLASERCSPQETVFLTKSPGE